MNALIAALAWVASGALLALLLFIAAIVVYAGYRVARWLLWH
jgi:hypothetical protein